MLLVFEAFFIAFITLFSTTSLAIEPNNVISVSTSPVANVNIVSPS